MIVPAPIAHGEADEGVWLVTEFIVEGPATSAAMRRLGEGLALLHGADTPDTMGGPGWRTDNWIGALPQRNGGSHETWSAFWVEERLRVQTDLARSRGRCADSVFDEVMEVTGTALSADLPLGLLHGDLWSGNFIVRDDGVPALIDPAVYVGHGEVDLAMTELFGGFSADFRDAYHDVRPISPEYEACRRPLYQLYYLLVHVNLFGRSYERGATEAARSVVRALR